MTKKRLKVLLAILIVILLVGSSIFFLPTKTTNEQIIFTSDKISNLKEISLDGNFNVNITTSDSKDIKCSFSKTKRGYVANEYELESKIENNVLYVTTNSKNKPNIVLGGEVLTVAIDIPKSYENKLFIKTELGKVNIFNSKSKDIECNVKDGNIKISLNYICGNIRVNAHLGDIDLKLPKDKKFKLSAKSHLGKVTNNLYSNVDSSIKDKNIKLSTSDGNINVS